MNYDSVIDATHNWISAKRVFWFIIFFCLSLPVLVMVPWVIEEQWVYAPLIPLVYLLFDLMYLCLIVGLLALTQWCLKQKNFSFQEISIGRIVDTVFLVLVEMWFVLVWNLHRAYRFTQLLLLIGIPLLYYYSLYNATGFIQWALALFIVLYAAMVFYNAIRVCFSVIIFYNKDVSIVEAVKDSWALTHRRFWHTLLGLLLSIAALFVLFAFIMIVLGALTNLVLLAFFTAPIAYSVTIKAVFPFALAPAVIGYYFAVIEIYAQLSKERSSGTKIRHALARRAIAAPRRSFAGKKAVRAKSKSKAKPKKRRR